MFFVKWVLIGLLLLPVAEVATFILMGIAIGWLPTVLLFVGTTVAGVMLLRHFGRADLQRLREALATDGMQTIKLDTPGLGAMIGAILLVLPGFLTDLIGLVLLVPMLRRRIGATIGRARATHDRARRNPRDASVIDLGPDEWRQVTSIEHKPEHKPKPDRDDRPPRRKP